MSSKGEEMTFWSLMNRYDICVPILQRDYVQGRKKDQVIDARQKLLTDICKAIVTDGNLDLNFIYGKVHGNKDKKVFIPLDGQQRLTTLFLLYWFAFVRELDYTNISILNKFSYETRTSSRKFIEQLVIKANMLADTVNVKDKKISEQIKNEAWFWVDWAYDPTIDSMLVMLDEIKSLFWDINDLGTKLISGTNISFRFLDMKELGMEDSLYIKLNARGRPLTDFENFKAELVKYLKGLAENGLIEKVVATTFSNKLDGKWTDLFWTWTTGNKEDFDKIYMNCFHWMLWNRWAEVQTRIEKSNFTITLAMNKTAYYRINSYREYDAIDGKVLQDLYYTLEYFSTQSVLRVLQESEVKYFKKCSLYSGSVITYEDRVMLSAVTCFLGSNKESVDSDALHNWLRVFRNLSRNTRLDGLDDFVRAVKSVASLSQYSSNILEYLASKNCDVSGFLINQIEEERLKAKLILIGNGWREAIIDAEKHPYFEGQIASLLNFSGLDIKTIDNLSKGELFASLQIFNVYKEKLGSIFNENGVYIDSFLLRRAVLSKGDYTLLLGSCKSFLINSHRDISWKALLGNNNSNKREFFKAVLDELDQNDLSQVSINNQLQKIINDAVLTDWRHYFVKMDKLIENCGSHMLIHISQFGKILLVSCQTTSGYNKELGTFVIYLKLLSQRKNPHYCYDRGQFGEMYINQIGGKDIMVKHNRVTDATNNSSKWGFQITYEGDTHDKDNINDTINYIYTLL